MNKTKIKICGVRNASDAEKIAKLGANFIGLIFHPSSKRFVDTKIAKEIADIAKTNGAKPVAVFVNHTAEEMLNICKDTGIEIVQLHGKITREQHYLLPNAFQRIYAMHVDDTGKILEDEANGLQYCDLKRDYLIFDAKIFGSGKTFDWKHFKLEKSKQKKFDEFRWFLAGGLTPENVHDAVHALQPTGVDVASGVESAPGVKDFLLIAKFIDITKQYKSEL